MPEPTPTTSGRRRTGDALSKDLVVDAAIALLDEHGERGFTFPRLTAHLRTGNGAIYWHVANKDELVALAADRALAQALTAARPGSGTGAANAIDQLRALAVGVFDALDRHPWAAAHVTTGPAQPNALRIMDRIGSLLTAAGLPAAQRFAVTTALFHYAIGVSAQITGSAVTIGATLSRDEFLARNAARWEGLDPAEYPFLAHAAAELREHDDREQYLTGLELVLGGVAAALKQA